MQLLESHVAYEEGSSTITSPSIIEEREHEEATKLGLLSRRSKLRSRHCGKQMKDLIEITKIYEKLEKPQIKANEIVIEAAVEEMTDKEFDTVEPVLEMDTSVSKLVLSEEARKKYELQKLKKLFPNFPMIP